MLSNVCKLLIELESKCGLRVMAPASDNEIRNMKLKYPVLPMAVLDIFDASEL